MKLSNRWFPTNLPAQAVWFANFNTQFQIVAASLGLATEMPQVDKDNMVMQFLADIANQLKAFEDAVRQYRKIITEGAVGTPTPEFPANPAFALPNTIPTGMFERLNDLRDRIMVAPNYTDEIGALLGILSSQPEPVSPSDAKLTLKGFEAASGAVFSAVVGNRAESDSWDVYVLRKGGSSWQFVGRFLGKSADVQVPLTTPGQPEQLQARVQGRKNNQNYGQPSDAVELTINP